MKIVFIGDSLTYAYRIKRKDAWTSLVANRTGNECINKGINGDTTSGMLSRFKADVLNEKPNYVHIMGGTNDMICQVDLGFVRANIMAMMHQAQAKNIIPILGVAVDIHKSTIASYWQGLPDYDKLESDMAKQREWLVEFSQFFGVKLIDYKSKIYEYCDEDSIAELYSDGLHLSEKGNQLLAEIFTDYYLT